MTVLAEKAYSSFMVKDRLSAWKVSMVFDEPSGDKMLKAFDPRGAWAEEDVDEVEEVEEMEEVGFEIGGPYFVQLEECMSTAGGVQWEVGPEIGPVRSESLEGMQPHFTMTQGAIARKVIVSKWDTTHAMDNIGV